MNSATRAVRPVSFRAASTNARGRERGDRSNGVDSETDGGMPGVARDCVNIRLIEEHWDDMLRFVGSLKLDVSSG